MLRRRDTGKQSKAENGFEIPALGNCIDQTLTCAARRDVPMQTPSPLLIAWKALLGGSRTSLIPTFTFQNPKEAVSAGRSP